MPVLTVGSTEIPYSIRYSTRAKRMSIRVTPDLVEAVAPEDVSRDRVDSFVKKKRQWITAKSKTWSHWKRDPSSPGRSGS